MKLKATTKDAEGVEFVFSALGYGWLRARAEGDSVLVINGAAERIRLRKISTKTWRVEIKFDEDWEPTPNKGPRGNMVAALVDLFNQSREGGLR